MIRAVIIERTKVRQDVGTGRDAPYFIRRPRMQARFAARCLRCAMWRAAVFGLIASALAWIAFAWVKIFASLAALVSGVL